MSTLFCFALKEEAVPFHKLAAGYPGISTLIVGIGRQTAEKSIRSFLCNCSPDRVFTCGFAGGLNPDYNLGDVVFEIADRRDGPLTSNSDGDSWNSSLRNELLAAGAKPVKFACADRIATTAMEKWELWNNTGADAVEMESAAIHAVCAERGIPCITVRVISDTAHEDLPLDFNALSRPDKGLDFRKLVWAIVRAPGKIGDLMKLQKRTRFAAEQLASVLKKLV
ncbi:MAG: hypothetical protein WCH99_16335 [Verrucomicrobiota bacterium]